MPFCFSFCYLVDPTGMIVLTPTLDIPRRFQILSTWPGNRAILERSRPPISAKSCLEETACTCLLLLSVHLVVLLHTAFACSMGDKLGELDIFQKSPLMMLFICFCCVLARTGFVPCFRVRVPVHCVHVFAHVLLPTTTVAHALT